MYSSPMITLEQLEWRPSLGVLLMLSTNFTGLMSISVQGSGISDNDHSDMSMIVSLLTKKSILDGSGAGDMFYPYFFEWQEQIPKPA